jgi:hypothetical protein
VFKEKVCEGKGDHHIIIITHGAEPFSRSRQLCSYSRTSQHFMEPGDSKEKVIKKKMMDSL